MQDQSQIESEIEQFKEAGPRLEEDGLAQIQDMQDAVDKLDEESNQTKKEVRLRTSRAGVNSTVVQKKTNFILISNL